MTANRQRLFQATAAVLLLGATSCSLFDTRATEGSGRRGPAGFDPYVGGKSGAVRLGLQFFKDCAINATGEPVGKGNAHIPYPATCPRHPAQEPVPAVPVPQPMNILSGTDYFLGQFAVTDIIDNAHLDPTNMVAPAEWITHQSKLNHLDWRGLGVVSDTMVEASAGNFTREVMFSNALWQKDLSDTFTLELLDGDGAVRASQTYRRLDLLAQNPVAGHTRIAWTMSNLGAPKFPGDLTIHPVPPGGPNDPPVGPPSSLTMARMEVITEAHPERSVSVPADLVGDGAFRLTWSLLPNEPFYLPVRFINRDALPLSCLDATGTPVSCTFGLQPDVTFSTPANGSFYERGESFEVIATARDGNGNALHGPEALPSWNDYYFGRANGLLYANLFVFLETGEFDSISGAALAGPLDRMRFSYERGATEQLRTKQFMSGFAEGGTSMLIFPTFAAVAGALVGGKDAPVLNHFRFKVPADAPPGTYVFELKLHRQFLGERVTKAKPFFFQVGQAERTQFPGRVGNCQLCHRGTISLENVRHGLPVDFIEGCKTCHNADEPQGGKSVSMIHEVHMGSPKFPRAKNDCAVCHLTRESTLRPSLEVCGSCHPQPHGTEFFQLSQQSVLTPTTTGADRYSNCGQSCHGITPPVNHLVPAR